MSADADAVFYLEEERRTSRNETVFDMDGTLSVFNKDAGPDIWSAPGYARNLAPITNMVRAVKLLINNPEYYGDRPEVYILSAVVSMDFAVEDKKMWLKTMGINIPEKNLIFVPYGTSKADALAERGIEVDPDGSDVFIDDYTKNLIDMQMNSDLTPVKVLNGINDTHKTWQGARISADSSPRTIADTLVGIGWVSRATQAA